MYELFIFDFLAGKGNVWYWGWDCVSRSQNIFPPQLIVETLIEQKCVEISAGYDHVAVVTGNKRTYVSPPPN